MEISSVFREETSHSIGFHFQQSLTTLGMRSACEVGPLYYGHPWDGVKLAL